ncbi:MAG: autotransporter outer membrane beta-barrel domain-containing protein [Gemmatimonadota bacterium]|jgi:outer membrane autotransporter protein|nr:autotransporter outer membrane beta-barrel domain-containing protein [Gemmatimonadota bacterium]
MGVPFGWKKPAPVASSSARDQWRMLLITSVVVALAFGSDPASAQLVPVPAGGDLAVEGTTTPPSGTIYELVGNAVIGTTIIAPDNGILTIIAPAAGSTITSEAGGERAITLFSADPATGLYSGLTLDLEGGPITLTGSTGFGGFLGREDSDVSSNGTITINGDLGLLENTSLTGGAGIFSVDGDVVINGSLVAEGNTQAILTRSLDKPADVVVTHDVVLTDNESLSATYTGGAIGAMGSVSLAEQGDSVMIRGNSSASNGGAISALGDVTIGNLTSTDSIHYNHAGTAGNVGNNSGDGGAIFVGGESGTVTIVGGNTRISSNSAIGSGGAIANLGQSSSSDIVISDRNGELDVDYNTAGNAGGALFISAQGGSVDITGNNVHIRHNYAAGGQNQSTSGGGTSGGGAIAVLGGDVLIRSVGVHPDSTREIHFVDNVAGYDETADTHLGGGAIYAAGKVQIEYEGIVRFLDNLAGYGENRVEIEGSNVSGGAIVAGGPVLLKGTIEVSGNRATGNGGAIYSTSAPTITLDGKGRLDIHGNEAGYYEGIGDGGAIYGGASTDVILGLTADTIAIGGNVAHHGSGGAVYTGGNVEIGGMSILTSITGNKAQDGDGGAIRAGGNVTITGTQISDNEAGGNGGAISSASFTLNATTTDTISNNRAGLLGGAVYVDRNVTLNATGGDILFQENTQNTSLITEANAIWLNNTDSDGVATFNAAPTRTITFFDPIRNTAANGLLTVNKTGTGTLTFDGAQQSAASDRWSVVYGNTAVQAGTFLVQNNAVYGALGADVGQINPSLFLVNSGATLALGMGEVRADSVNVSGTLKGTGTVTSGTVVVAANGVLDPGGVGASGPVGVLTINGDLRLNSLAVLNYNFGEVNANGADTATGPNGGGGLQNDLTVVTGDLTLDGTLNVTATPGGLLPGVYRVINYAGTLTDNTLALGGMPAGSEQVVQTSVANQVNLVVVRQRDIPGQDTFWDGAAGPHGNGAINGGNGVWQSGAGNDNWTNVAGDSIGTWDDGQFAFFQGTAGTVTVDNSLGQVTTSGMHFDTNGYVIAGDSLELVGDSALIGVGTGYTARISSKLVGNSSLVKTSQGTLVLSGANSYTGNTSVLAGTLQMGAANVLPSNTRVTVAAAGTLDLAGFNQTVEDVTNSGLISFGTGTAPGTTLTVDGNYVGNGNAAIALNTVFGGDNSATDKLVINGSASGTTTLRFTNVGGQGGETVQGIRVVQATGTGTTTANAFTLGGQRYTAGAFEYLLERKNQDWFLVNGVRPETPLYAPIPAMGRSLGLFTVRTLHERVGEEENLRGQAESRSVLNGLWARALGERQTNTFSGVGNPSADGNLWGGQLGLDLYRHTTDGGHQNHFGAMGSYSGFSSNPVRGDALGETDIKVGELELKGASAGLYWTHFSPTGWYLDAVGQVSRFDVKAASLSGTHLNTDMGGVTASLETGYPIHIGTDGMWLVEPQAQVIWQGFDVTDARDELADVSWNTSNAWTGRLGARIQQSEGPLWQRYGLINVWHDFNGTDGIVFDGANPANTRFGGTALEGGLGMTAKAGRLLSIYGEATYRHSVGGGPRESTGVFGTLGVRLNW